MSNEDMRLTEMAPKYPDRGRFIIDSNINRNTDNFKLLRKSYVLSLVIPFFFGIWCVFYLIGCTLPGTVGSAIDYNNDGVEKMDRKDYEEAIKDFSEAIRLNPNFAWAYYHRGRALRQLDQGTYWAARHDFSTALTLADQQEDSSLVNRIRKSDGDVRSYKIFDGERAIRELKKLGYEIHEMDSGYRLTKIKKKRIQAYRETEGRKVETEREYIAGKYDVECRIGQPIGRPGIPLLEEGAVWLVDRNGKIWLAVFNPIVIRVNR